MAAVFAQVSRDAVGSGLDCGKRPPLRALRKVAT
jgi:hypothetical protein